MSSDCDVIRCRYPEFAPRSVAVAGGWVLRKVRRTSAVRSRVDAGEASFRSWATSGSLVRSRCRCPETDGVVVPVPGEPVERRSLLAVQAEVAEVVEGLSNELGDLAGVTGRGVVHDTDRVRAAPSSSAFACPRQDSNLWPTA